MAAAKHRQRRAHRIQAPPEAELPVPGGRATPGEPPRPQGHPGHRSAHQATGPGTARPAGNARTPPGGQATLPDTSGVLVTPPGHRSRRTLAGPGDAAWAPVPADPGGGWWRRGGPWRGLVTPPGHGPGGSWRGLVTPP